MKIIEILFDTEISSREIPLFRGAVIKAANSDNILFHNHLFQQQGYRYGYPLIQYKRQNGKAAITCIGEGVDAIEDFFAECNFDINLGKRIVRLMVENISIKDLEIAQSDIPVSYTIGRWMPLNQENYRNYRNTTGLADKCALLERLLVGNILSMSKGLDIFIDTDVLVQVTNLEERKPVFYKGVQMQTFDIDFRSNLVLPTGIGLGKGVSHGFGTLSSNR